MSTAQCSSVSGSADCCRPTNNAPKPNTRFLRNIIKETDSHNAALRAREVQDARARLRRLRDDNSESSLSSKRRGDEENRHRKRRRLDHRHDEDSPLRQRHEKSGPKRKSDDDQESRGSRQHRHRDYRSNEGDEDLRDQKHSHHHRSDRHRSPGRSKERVKGPSHRRSSRHKDRSRSPGVDDGERRCYRKGRRERTGSLSATPERKPPDFAKSETLPANPGLQPQGGTQETSHKSSITNESDSDPLESVIGPYPPPSAPKVQARGRGSFASSSAIDSHFSSNYNPAKDVYPNSGSEDDWDQALEALRDRQRWKQQGADRLRSAGFTEEEVGKWEKGGEKNEEDVQWKRKGEGREWDRGKIVGEEWVETRPGWGRLKGT